MLFGARECQEKKNLPGGALARSISKGTKMFNVFRRTVWLVKIGPFFRIILQYKVAP